MLNSININKKFENLMENSLNLYKENLKKINININYNFINFIKIKEDNKILKLKDISFIKIDDKKNIIIEPIDKKYIKLIYEEIKNFDLNLNIIITGKNIKIINTILDKNEKLKLVKLIKKENENFKISIRNIRRDANNEIKKNINFIKNKEIILKEIQKITDYYIENIEKIYLEKIKNLNL